MRDFKKLLIWQVGMDIVDKVYDIVPHLPVDEKFGLRSQMTRSATGIPSTLLKEVRRRVRRTIRDLLKFH